VLGAWRNAVGKAEIHRLFGYLGERFSDCGSFEYEVLACDVVGDMAYTVCLEQTSASVDGVPRTYIRRYIERYILSFVHLSCSLLGSLRGEKVRKVSVLPIEGSGPLERSET
jgi:hypothetical protein